MPDYIYNLYLYNQTSALKGLLNTIAKMYYSYICVHRYMHVWAYVCRAKAWLRLSLWQNYTLIQQSQDSTLGSEIH